MRNNILFPRNIVIQLTVDLSVYLYFSQGFPELPPPWEKLVRLVTSQTIMKSVQESRGSRSSRPGLAISALHKRRPKEAKVHDRLSWRLWIEDGPSNPSTDQTRASLISILLPGPGPAWKSPPAIGRASSPGSILPSCHWSSQQSWIHPDDDTAAATGPANAGILGTRDWGTVAWHPQETSAGWLWDLGRD